MAPVDFKSTDIKNLRSRFTNEAFDAMKKEFPDQDDDDIARFLIARNGDVTKAAPLLQKHLSWRSENLPPKADSFYREYVKGKIYVEGQDMKGHPIIDEMIMMSVYWMEVAITAMPADKSQVTFLFDRTGSTAENVDLDFIKALAKVMQDNYPERLYKVLVHPVGILFYTGWSLAKWALDKNTQEKVQPMLYLSGIQQHISDDYIPEHMGGKNTFKFAGKDLEKLTSELAPTGKSVDTDQKIVEKA